MYTNKLTRTKLFKQTSGLFWASLSFSLTDAHYCSAIKRKPNTIKTLKQTQKCGHTDFCNTLQLNAFNGYKCRTSTAYYSVWHNSSY